MKVIFDITLFKRVLHALDHPTSMHITLAHNKWFEASLPDSELTNIKKAGIPYTYSKGGLSNGQV